MKRRIISGIMVSLLAITFFASCKKDYIVGGKANDASLYKNVSTYDVLKSNPLFDTLVQLIDTAGLKDKINASGTTFFAPTDRAIYDYMQTRTLFIQENVDQYGKFPLDSVFYYLRNNIDGTRDSLLMYLVNTSLTFNVLTAAGNNYATGLANDTAIVSYEFTKDVNLGYNPLVSSIPQVVYYTHLWYPYHIGPNTPIDSIPYNAGVHTLVQTSGIQTQNGILNVLENGHVLFFYGTKQ